MLVIICLFLYLILHVSVIKLSVERVLSIYNEFYNYNSILRLFRLIILTIISSFIFTPYLSFIILRTFFIKSNIKLPKSKKTIRIFLEIGLDLLIPLFVFTLLFISLQKFNTYFFLISYICILIISFKEFILFFLNKNKKLFKYKYSESSNKYIKYSFITINRSLRIISRDLTLASLIYLSQNNLSLFSNNFIKIFEQTVIYCSSSYIQVLPANLYIPEYICGIFDCNFFNTNLLRLGIIPVSICALIILEIKNYYIKYQS